MCIQQYLAYLYKNHLILKDKHGSTQMFIYIYVCVHINIYALAISKLIIFAK